MPISCPTSVALAHEAQFPRSVGAELSRAELMEDASMAREAHEALRRRFNSLVDDVKACR